MLEDRVQGVVGLEDDIRGNSSRDMMGQGARELRCSRLRGFMGMRSVVERSEQEVKVDQHMTCRSLAP